MVNFFVKFLSEPTVVLGLVAMIGLIAMKNRPSTVIQGTMKTMLGFLILSAGSSLIASALTPFSTMFNAAFGMSGVVPEDNALVAAVQTVLGFETPMIMLLSFVINIILARITPFKYIFLTGHMMFHLQERWRSCWIRWGSTDGRRLQSVLLFREFVWLHFRQSLSLIQEKF